jgi:Cft2 family RNA processing exonuclease
MSLFPEAPVLVTPPTLALLRVLFERAQLEEPNTKWELAFSSTAAPGIEEMLERLQPVAFDQPFSLLTKQHEEWQLTFRRAGHLLGAAMVLLETRHGSVLISGDVSLTPQHTVGRALPPRQPVDMLVLESTFGNRNLPLRKTEEAKLVAQVRAATAREGHILIAASALGEAQEVIASLVTSRLVGQGARQLWTDGLIRDTNPVFSMYVPEERPSFTRLVALHGDAFRPSGQIRWVEHQAERDAVLGGPPAIIVSSAPDLQHGPSAFYAARLASDDQSTILIPARVPYTPSATNAQAPPRVLNRSARSAPTA